MIYIYLDESGDLGYSKKSTRYFVIALLATENPKPINNCIKRVRQRRLKKKFKKIPELKFNNSNAVIRKRILKCIANREVKLYYILLDKQKAYERKHEFKTDFYSYLTGFLIHQIIREKEDIELIVDKSLSKEKREEFNEYVRKRVLTKLKTKIKIKVEHRDSKEDKCIQAADFVAGAIFSKFEFSNDSYYKIIEDRVKQEVVFFEK